MLIMGKGERDLIDYSKIHMTYAASLALKFTLILRHT